MSEKKNLEQAISNIIKVIKEYNKHRKLFQDLFRKVKYQLDPSSFPEAFQFNTKDTSFIVQVPQSSTTGLKYAGVDGGIIHRSMNFFDVALIRAVGVLFYHNKDEKPKVKYFPEKNPFPDILTSVEPLAQNEIDYLITLWRIQKEIRCAIDLLENDSPDILILDGSVLPVIDVKSIQGNDFLFSQYLRLKALYRRLYILSRKKRCLLCGVIKDSRSAILTRKLSLILPHLSKRPEFKELLDIDYRPIVKQLRDTDLLFNVLDINERTFESHLCKFNEYEKDLEDFDIHFFYLKTAEYDTPLRVEFPILFSDSTNLAQTISSLICSISTFHPEYGLPSVIIEADARAKIREDDADILIDEISSRIGYSSFSLQKRRARNPWS
ncbi:MAG: DNA double-strand break repair nuclease NurA [Candidatus Heimdallarchaeaceae archaeon]